MKPPAEYRHNTDVVVPIEPEADQRAKTMLAPEKRKRQRAKLQFKSMAPTDAPPTPVYPPGTVLATVRWFAHDGELVSLYDVPFATVPSKGQVVDLEGFQGLDAALAAHYDAAFFVDGKFRGAADFSNLLVMSVSHVAGPIAELVIDVTDPAGGWCMSCGEPISEEEMSWRLREPLLELTKAAQEVTGMGMARQVDASAATALRQLNQALLALPGDWRREAAEQTTKGDTTP